MRKQKKQSATVRTYKDSLFRMIFSDKKELLTLYNALNGSDYTDPDELEIKTLENAIYLNMKNDLSFLLHDRLYLYEHQSTFNPNMPLRDLLYAADQLQEMVKEEDLYKSTQVRIPTPEFVTFYNGKQKQPERQLLKLSDAFEKRVERLSLELIVTMLNMNVGYNKELMKQCRTLRDYALYVEKIRTYSKTMETDAAVERAVTECIRDGILKDFLLRQRAEAYPLLVQRDSDLLRKQGGYKSDDIRI